ncbi:MAG: DNA recombination protein RmuC [Puniceicoccales bacterium]|jgi:DNA recombination protein RmuC|nr:DNA recombination protein RmuC [Puniceicoccales bacterium]
MTDILLALTLLAAIGAVAGVAALLLRRPPPPDHAPIRDELTRQRTEQAAQLDRIAQNQDQRLENLRATLDDAHAKTRAELTTAATTARADARAQFDDFRKTAADALTDARAAQNQQLTDFATRLAQLQTTLADALAKTRSELNATAADTRKTLDTRLDALSAQNAAKLEEMRLTVDEKLQSTLEKRLGENFKLVGENLEKVARSLGEMQQMAASVGDLKRVLTNVKTRGTWGEYQLGNILEQLLTPDQYAANIPVRPNTQERVEYAIRLPGRSGTDTPVWLPLDAKFPVEDYERLLAAAERADADAVAAATKALAARITEQAKTIAQKYIAPPHTTDFAILFLPTEGLYAEVLRQPGLADTIQRVHRVVLAGPTTLSALVNSLQMGFRTLAIEQRAGEVWKVLGAVKTEFDKFGEVLEAVQKKLDAASKEIEKTNIRTRAIGRKLRDVEALPVADSELLLPDDDGNGSNGTDGNGTDGQEG